MARLLTLVLVVVLVVAFAAGCGGGQASDDGTLRVVAAEDFWGDIAAQLGGTRVSVRSIISDPGVDPHLYESDAGDAGAVARADLVIENGLGYDDAIGKLLASGSRGDRAELVVADVLNAPAGANPHLWYDIPRVPAVAQAIVAELVRLDPEGRTTYEANLTTFTASLQPLLDAIDDVAQKHGGDQVAYTEPVAAYLLEAMHLVGSSPNGYASAIEEGNEPAPEAVQAMEKLLQPGAVAALVYNTQAESPITQDARAAAQDSAIPVVGVTETMPDGVANFQAWQQQQIDALRGALAG